MVFICKLSQSRLQVGQTEWSFPDLAHEKAIAVFVTHVKYLAETLLRKKTSWVNPVRLASLLPKVETFLDGGIGFAYAS